MPVTTGPVFSQEERQSWFSHKAEVAKPYYYSVYPAAPDGYCGDEDNGQTSAWYVFSAMSFYPVCPGSNEYALGTPIFKEVTVNLTSGKKIRISDPGNSRDNFYIKGMKLNGKTYTNNYLRHEKLVNGASIVYDMASEPNFSRGTAESDRPYSFSR